MILPPPSWGCLRLLLLLLAAGSAKVVVQPDGIISIITELEPDKTPVAYLQAVDSNPARAAPSVVNNPPVAADNPPLEDGEFRVTSEKIRIVDPETGFKVVHDSVPQKEQVDKRDTVKRKEENRRRSGYETQPESDYRVVYPEIIPEDLARYPDKRRFKENDSRNGPKRYRKVGQYGYQTPRRANTVRTDKTTRIRNNDEPPRVYKHTVVRPVTQEDEVRRVKKFGKAGRYGKNAGRNQGPRSVTISKAEEVNDGGGGRNSPDDDPERRKTRKEFSSNTVSRFPDGFEQGNERRVETSSQYNSGSTVKNSPRPQFQTSARNENSKLEPKRNADTVNSIKDKIEQDQPLQEASSFRSGVLEIDDGLLDDGVIYKGGGYSGGYGDDEKHYVKEKGKDYISAHGSAHGGKGQKGYNNEEAFSKGQNEKHGHDENKGFAVEKEGDKKSHLDKSSHYGSGHHATEGAKGDDYHKEKGHRKGHKKSGFRSVHHKDEYKKDEEFYDEEHNSGNEQKQGHRSEQHGEKHGGKDRKEYLDAGHHQASRGHEGGHEKGHGYNQQKGYQKEKGHSGHYGNEEEYGKKSGHKEGEVHGHSEHGGLGGHGYY